MALMALAALLHDPQVLRASAPAAAADPGGRRVPPGSGRLPVVAPQGPDLPRLQPQTGGALPKDPPKVASGGRVSLQ